MKAYYFLILASAAVISLPPRSSAQSAPQLNVESAREFFATGDFDGDGRADLVLADKETGKYRLAYQLKAGAYSWVDNRPSGIKGVSGFNVGKLFAPKVDALVFSSADANQFALIEAASPTAPGKPLAVA